MIKLPVLQQNERKKLKELIQSKHEPAKTGLNNVYGYILEDYLKYYKYRHRLEAVTADIRVIGAKSCLNKAYTEGKVIDSVKANITKIMPPAVKEKCPYCMLSEPGTFDHYLGKGRFPEYSVLAKNLVPCCSKCNSKKGEDFLTIDGKRMFISFYFDVLPQSPFFVVEVDIDENVPYIKDTYTIPITGTYIDEIIKSHFDNLDLFERYKQPMTNKLSLLVTRIKGSRQCKANIIANIKDEISVLEKIYGLNYWESCLYRGIINNNDVLSYLEKVSLG